MSKLKIGPGVMLSRRAGKTDLMRQIHQASMVSKEIAAASASEVEEGVFVPTSSIKPGVIVYEPDAALKRLMEAGAKLAAYENGDFPDPKVTYKQIVAEYLAALDGAKDE